MPEARINLRLVSYRQEDCEECSRDSFKDLLESCKWNLWHGNVEESLSKLEMLIIFPMPESALDQRFMSIWTKIRTILLTTRNAKGLGKTFTTQVAESHIESIINARHKRVERCNGVGKGRTTFFKSAQKSSTKLGWDSGNRQCFLL